MQNYTEDMLKQANGQKNYRAATVLSWNKHIVWEGQVLSILSSIVKGRGNKFCLPKCPNNSNMDNKDALFDIFMLHVVVP